MNLLLASLLLMVVALGGFALIGYAERRATTARRRRAYEELVRTGLNVVGDPLALFTLWGQTRGVGLTLRSLASARLPGPSGRDRDSGPFRPRLRR